MLQSIMLRKMKQRMNQKNRKDIEKRKRKETKISGMRR